MSDKIREALAGLLAIVDESEGVAGYHLNGEIAEWYTFAEVDAAREALAEAPPAQQSQWVPVSERLPDIDVPVWVFEPVRGIWIGGRGDADDGWLWAHAQGTEWFRDGRWKADLFIDDEYKPTHWMPLPAAPGDTAAPEHASCAECGKKASDGWALYCVKCAEQIAPSAPEQAGTTSDQYRAELYDEVWQKARDMGYGNVTEALVALERVKEQAEQDAVKVPRKLLRHVCDWLFFHEYPLLQGDKSEGYRLATELRALLGGDA